MLDKIPQIKSSPEDDFFESKDVHKERFLINGAQVDSIDVIPKTLKTEIPVLVAPGWGATMENFKPAIEVLANKNRRVISLNQPRRGGEIPNLDYNNKELEEWYKKKGKKYPKFPSEFLRQANTVNGLLDQKKLDKVDVITHSMGGPAVCIAAMLHPEKFAGRTIVLYSPAGLIGKDSLPRLMRGTMTQLDHPDSISKIPVTKTEEERLKLAGDNAQAHGKANPFRALKEVIAISQAQIEDMLRYLHEKGIRIIVVGAVDDTYFPMGDVKEEIDEEGNVKKRYFVGNKGMQKNVKPDFIDGFLSVSGGHEQIKTHPEIYIKAIESMLTTIEEKAGKK
jgi:pimeloyl-ACP methyl ester carboxylesterase